MSANSQIYASFENPITEVYHHDKHCIGNDLWCREKFDIGLKRKCTD